MLIKLIETAEEKAGSQKDLAKRFGLHRVRLADYKAGRRLPDDVVIGKLAEYIGRDPVETILICKKETDKENAGLWENWCARRESNPRPSASETDTLSN